MIFIANAPCGIGKTTSAINMIKNNPEENYLYITPFLTEVQRIKEECDFYEPIQIKTKMNSMLWLLNNRKNIVSTHSLFLNFTESIINLIHDGEYNLILDEVADVVSIYEIKPNDLDNILNNYAHIEDTFLIWDKTDYDGRFNDIKELASNHCLAIYKNTALVWCFPIDVFKAFKNIYILTYMFDAQIQRYYYDYFGLKYQNIYVRNMNFTNEEQQYKLNIKDKISILDNDKLNYIGDINSSLSVSWYHRNDLLLKKLQKNIYNFCNNICNDSSELYMWTTFKDYKSKLKGKGYSKGFITVSMRATNEYKHKKYLAYCVNIYMNPILQQFFEQKNVQIDQEKYALSEMIQWIWRSAIRENENITIYIPSKRMRTLLINWINENS